MLNPIIKKIISQLNKADLSTQDRSALTASMLDKLQTLPTKRLISFDQQGTIQMNGRNLDAEQAIMFKDSSIALKENYARKILNEQKKMLAIEIGVHNGLNADMIIFSKACLWDIQQDEELLDKILEE